MVELKKKKVFLITIILSVGMLLISCDASAETISVANSEDWVDVCSVMLSASLKNENGIFINSKSIGSVTKALLTGKDVDIYESSTEPFIDNLNNQLTSLGYSVNNFEESEDFNLELDPQNGRYYVISRDSPKIAISAVPLAISVCISIICLPAEEEPIT